MMEVGIVVNFVVGSERGWGLSKKAQANSTPIQYLACSCARDVQPSLASSLVVLSLLDLTSWLSPVSAGMHEDGCCRPVYFCGCSCLAQLLLLSFSYVLLWVPFFVFGVLFC